MRALIVTEKCGAPLDQRDGGARLVESLRRGLGGPVDVMQFGAGAATGDGDARYRHRYPVAGCDRFSRRVSNAAFVAERVSEVAPAYTHVLFVHVSMQFGLGPAPWPGVRTWTFPMFLTPSYLAAGERVPSAYTEMERRTLGSADRILTPSHFERRQLIDEYDVAQDRVRVVPRGVDRSLLSPRRRVLEGPPLFCSIGSIKRQKNTVGLIRLFQAIRTRHHGARLRIVGPVQDAAYAREVHEAVTTLRLEEAVELIGHVSPTELPQAIADAHVHLSASACETFGRAIFETLASGIPNLAPARRNAAAEYLEHAPYAGFYEDVEDALRRLDAMLGDYHRLSAMALEVGELFDDAQLCRLLAAELREAEVFAVCDFDGTLYHKDAPERTRRSVDAFLRYPVRAVCSARPIPDLLTALEMLGVKVDFVIGWSGAVIADGAGNPISRLGFSREEADAIEARLPPGAARLTDGDTTLQFSVPCDPSRVDVPGTRLEAYQGTTFLGRWESSKLRAVHRLLRHLDWRGRVRAFGDGRYDEELLVYFDGMLVRPSGRANGRIRLAQEVTHEHA